MGVAPMDVNAGPGQSGWIGASSRLDEMLVSGCRGQCNPPDLSDQPDLQGVKDALPLSGVFLGRQNAVVTKLLQFRESLLDRTVARGV
jgi:hypothetical protein